MLVGVRGVVPLLESLRGWGGAGSKRSNRCRGVDDTAGDRPDLDVTHIHGVKKDRLTATRLFPIRRIPVVLKCRSRQDAK